DRPHVVIAGGITPTRLVSGGKRLPSAHRGVGDGSLRPAPRDTRCRTHGSSEASRGGQTPFPRVRGEGWPALTCIRVTRCEGGLAAPPSRARWGLAGPHLTPERVPAKPDMTYPHALGGRSR